MALIGWYQFKYGENITADTLNERLQGTILKAVDQHDHAVDPEKAYTVNDSKESGPKAWANFVCISDIATRINSLNQSALDHALDAAIHNAGSNDEVIAVEPRNTIAFQLLRPEAWEWKGHYWEQRVTLPSSFGLSDCNYVVYFQPVYPKEYNDFYDDLSNGKSNFHTLQGVCPLNHDLLDYNIMATDLKSSGFTVRMYALGRGGRYGVVKYPERLFMTAPWDVRRIYDATFEKPIKIQALEDRLYVLPADSRKVIVFSNKTGAVIDVIAPPAVLSDGTDETKWDFIVSFGAATYVSEGKKRFTCTMNLYSASSGGIYTYIDDGSRSAFLRVPRKFNNTGETTQEYRWWKQSGGGGGSLVSMSFIGPYLDGGCKQPLFLYDPVDNANIGEVYRFTGGARVNIGAVEEKSCEGKQAALESEWIKFNDGSGASEEDLLAIPVSTDDRIQALASWPADNGTDVGWSISGTKVVGRYIGEPVTRWYQWYNKGYSFDTNEMESVQREGGKQVLIDTVPGHNSALSNDGLKNRPVDGYRPTTIVWLVNGYEGGYDIVESVSSNGASSSRGVGGVKGLRTCVFDAGIFASQDGSSVKLVPQVLNAGKYNDLLNNVELMTVDAATNSVAYKENGRYYLEPLGLFDFGSWFADLKRDYDAADPDNNWWTAIAQEPSTVGLADLIGLSSIAEAQDYKYRLRTELPGIPISISGFRLPTRWKSNLSKVFDVLHIEHLGGPNNDYFILEGDQTAYFSYGAKVTIAGATTPGNNVEYTVHLAATDTYLGNLVTNVFVQEDTAVTETSGNITLSLGSGGSDVAAQVAYIFVWMRMPFGAQEYGLRCYVAMRLADGVQDRVDVNSVGEWRWGGSNRSYYTGDEFPVVNSEFDHESPSHITGRNVITPPVDLLMDITGFGSGKLTPSWSERTGWFQTVQEMDLADWILPFTSPYGHMARNVSHTSDGNCPFFTAVGEANKADLFESNPLPPECFVKIWEDTVGLSGGTVIDRVPMTNAMTEVVLGSESLRGIADINSNLAITDINASCAEFVNEEYLPPEYWSGTADPSQGSSTLLYRPIGSNVDFTRLLDGYDESSYSIVAVDNAGNTIETMNMVGAYTSPDGSVSYIETSAFPANTWPGKQFRIDIVLTTAENRKRSHNHNVILYLADEGENAVHAYYSSNSMEDNLREDAITAVPRYRLGSIIQNWSLDPSPPIPGIYKGFLAVDGEQAVYQKDYPVFKDSVMEYDPAHDTVQYGDYYDSLDWIRQRFSRWPSLRARYARYNVIAPALIENNDYLNGTETDSVISQMSFLCYARAVDYETKDTPAASFTMDPRFVSQIAVETTSNTDSSVYLDPSIVNNDDNTLQSNQSYLAYVPRVVPNSYIMGNIGNELNTMINSHFLLSKTDTERIDIFLDLSARGQRFVSYYLDPDDLATEVVTTFYPNNLYELKNSLDDDDIATEYLDSFDNWSPAEWDHNISIDNFALGMLVPASSSAPLGWNWLVFMGDKAPGSPFWKFYPKVNGKIYEDGEKDDWFAVTLDSRADWGVDLESEASGILSPAQVYGYGFAPTLVDAEDKVIFRLTLVLGDKFRDMMSPVCEKSGLDVGISVPFAPTIHTATDRFSGVFSRDDSYAGSFGYNTDGSLKDHVPYDPYSGLSSESVFDTVQLYDVPLCGGGVWLSILSAPLKVMPRYLSKYVLGDNTRATYWTDLDPNSGDVMLGKYLPVAGSHLPHYFPVKSLLNDMRYNTTGGDLGALYNSGTFNLSIDGATRAAFHRELSIGNRLRYDSGITRMFLLNDFWYYQILRAIKVS